MPIKFPKGFNRRRSSGNALEIGEAPAQSSFRVLERPDTTKHSSDGNLPLRRPVIGRPNSSPSDAHLKRPESYGNGSEFSNRASGNTHNSNSTGGGRSEKRFSYASTTQTSVESQDDLNFSERPKYAPLPRTTTEPVEPQAHSRKTFSLKAAGRTFSFGPRSHNIKENYHDPPSQNRERATTASSYASTATPPKLDLGGSDSGFGQSGFGDVFGKRRSTTLEDVPPVPPVPSNAFDAKSPSYQPASGGPKISPTRTVQPVPNDLPRQPGSPYSFTSHDSHDQLMSSPLQPHRSVDSTDNFASTFAADPDSQLVLEALYASNALEQHHSPQPSQHIPDRSYPRGGQPPSAWSGPSSIKPGPYQTPAPKSPLSFSDAPGRGIPRITEPRTAPRRGPNTAEESLFDAPRPRRLVPPNPRVSLAMKTSNKVMTPAEFEAYKARKAQGTQDDDTKSQSSSDSETYEDEDETERTKQLARQRRRQEAQLSVYRQQMMKVTGEQPSDLPDSGRSQMPLSRSTASAPSLLGSLSFDPGKTGKESDEEDDEVPLGVLQAHGFPARNRPPTRISSSMSAIPRPESQLSIYPSPAGATRNDASAGGGGNTALPIFAKHLPQDPYVGASLVNTSNREAIGMSANGMSSPGQQPAPAGLPPGGLVGVIAGEERARAQRRGSPNARGTYDAAPSGQTAMDMHQQQMMLAQQQQMMSQPMTLGEQSTMQAAQQMQQMMQVQMQWMQQMMQMQGIDPSQMPGMAPQLPQPHVGHPNGFLAPSGQMRPTSTASALFVPGGQANRMSMMSRGASTKLAGSMFSGVMPRSSATSMYGMPQTQGGYAPSLALSERSNVGQPSRYRPVTLNSNEQHSQDSRTSTMSTVQGLGMKNKNSKSNLKTTSSAPLTVTTTNRPKSRLTIPAEDENDDEGWAKLAKKREQRKSMWKMKRPESTLPGSQEGGLEGLYYVD